MAIIDNKSEIVIKIHKPNINEYLFFLLSGVVISIPFTIFYESFADQFCYLLPVFTAQICSIAIIAPFIEEFAKAYPLFYRHGETQRSIFQLGFLTGFGFGLTEFFIYVTVLNASVLIRIPALFFHAASTSIVAYGIATKKPMLFYLIAVALHFFNNFFAIMGDIWYIGGPLTLFLTYFISYTLYTRTSETVVVNNV